MHVAHHRRRDPETTPDGFTIAELVLVLVFVVGLATVAIVSVSGIREQSSQRNCQTDLRTLKLATAQYAAQKDVFPADKAQLVASGLVRADEVERWTLSGGNALIEPNYRPVDPNCS